jgi:hypothetical protein
MNGAWLILAVGVGLLFAGIWARVKYDPKKWRVAKARVRQSYPCLLPSNTGLLYRPCVEYTYEVNGYALQGNTYAYSASEDSNGKEMVAKLLIAYPVGASIDIWYRIDDPSTSCIKLDSAYSRSQMYAIQLGGLLLVLCGLAVWGVSI